MAHNVTVHYIQEQRRLGRGESPSALVKRLYPLWAANPTAWIVLLPLESILERAAKAEAVPEHERGPLWGIPFAVKDNVHCPAGVTTPDLPSTGACKAYQWDGPGSPVVQALVDAGGIVVGKTNLDQFAAGLNGTRSPYGTARNAFDERFIPGGSSAGSGPLVGSNAISFALGTDTAGSGRVPANFNGCIGVKPTVGLVSSDGVMYACRSLDCLTVFVGSVEDARLLLSIMSGPRERSSPSYRALPPVIRRWNGVSFRFGVPQDKFLDFGGPGGSEVAKASAALFKKAIARLERIGGKRVESFDFTPFAETAALLYGAPFVAERYSGIRKWLESSGKEPKDDDRLEPILGVILQSALKFNAIDAFDGYKQLAANAGRARHEWDKVDMMMTPTALHHYMVAELEKDEKHTKPANGAKNSNLGKFTNYMNLLDCCALAVPSGVMTQCVEKAPAHIAGIDHEIAVLSNPTNDEEKARYESIKAKPATLPWGVTLVTEAFGDQFLLDIADKWTHDSNLKCGPQGHHITH